MITTKYPQHVRHTAWRTLRRIVIFECPLELYIDAIASVLELLEKDFSH
jgi:hypothetical protein